MMFFQLVTLTNYKSREVFFLIYKLACQVIYSLYSLLKYFLPKRDNNANIMIESPPNSAILRQKW